MNKYYNITTDSDQNAGRSSVLNAYFMVESTNQRKCGLYPSQKSIEDDSRDTRLSKRSQRKAVVRN